MSSDETLETGQLPPQVEQAVERHLVRISAGERPDLDQAVQAVDAEHRSLFRVEVLAAEVLWFEGERDPARVDEVYSRCQDEAERSHVRSAVAGAHAAATCMPTALTPGDRIAGRYELIGELGRGGIGVVYEARDLELGRRVAIKAVRVDPGRDVAALTENLLEESRTLAGMDEANVVTIHDIVRDEDRVCVVLALVDGLSLEQVVARLVALGQTDPVLRLADLRSALGGAQPEGGPLGERNWYRAVAAIVARLAGSLEAAHAEGVLHRDIKPQNVILRPDGEPVLLDFGLAHRLGAKEGERFSGTPEYLAPEQIESYTIGQDRRTDVYALGLVLYELLALRRAFPRQEGEELQQLFARIVHRRFESLRSIDAGMPPVLERIVACAIAKDPDARYASAGQFAEDLERWLARRAPRQAPVEWHLRAGLFARRVGPPVGALLLLATLAYLLFWPDPKDQEFLHFLSASGSGPPRLDLDGALTVHAGEILGARFKGGRRQAIFAVSYFEDAEGVRRIKPVEVYVNDERPAEGWGNWLPPTERYNRVAVTKVEASNNREGMMLLLCRRDAAVIEGWLDALDLRIARAGLEGLPLDEAERMFEHLYTAGDGRGGSLDPSDLFDVDWGDAASGEQVATGILRWSALYPVER